MLFNIIFYSLSLFTAALSLPAMQANLTPDEQGVLDYLETLNLRYPNYGEDLSITNFRLSLNNFKASARAFLDEHKKQNDNIVCLCSAPARFFVFLLHGDAIMSKNDFCAYSGSPYLAHIGPRDSEAADFIADTNTVNCGLWIARTSRGWLGLSFEGLLILDSKQWIKRLIADLKRDYEHQIEMRFSNDEKAKILHYKLFEEDSWCLREMYKIPDDEAGVLSTRNDADWPSRKCEEVHQLIKTGQLTDFTQHFLKK